MENTKTPEALLSEIERLQAVVDSLNEKLFQFSQRSERDMNEGLPLRSRTFRLLSLTLTGLGR